ncbi:hypothetical protein ACSQ76_22000 [Roseovarius sp. B08]|uniref:hypothetical protein n=1 Tax=Roseovarius sp. B08 TaxID=3449223 RepID=UPI003EDB718F
MSHIESTIARIPFMDARARARLRKNAEDNLQKKPEDAHRVLQELDAFEDVNSQPQNLEKTGLLGWEKRPPDYKIYSFRAFHEGRVVGTIFKRANHSTTEKDVYSVEILSQQLPGKFHHIKDARAAGESAFAEQNARNNPQKIGRANPQGG